MSDHIGDVGLLHELAAAHRVATGYWGQAGNYVEVAPDTIRSVLAALGVDASDDAAIRESLEDARLREWRRVLPPVFVTWQGQERRLWVHVPHGTSVRAWVVLEDGSSRELVQWDWWVDPIDVDGVLTGEASFGVPGDLPVGWHEIRVSAPGIDTGCELAVAPASLRPSTIIGERQWGLMLQVYSMPDRDAWGLGDARSLGAVAHWSACEYGAGFILVNPLHAPVDAVPSPYLPSSRRFLSPLMIRPEDIPEVSRLDPKKRASMEKQRVHADAQWSMGSDMRIDRDRTWQAMMPALRLIFEAGRDADRQAAFENFASQESLRTFATWCVLAETHGSNFHQWPAALRDASSREVENVARERREDIDFYSWLQWIAAEQLIGVQDQCRHDGMAIGVITDLAVGVHPGGADAWALAPVLAQGVGVGAPPDMYNQQGQNWDQPPWRPDALAEAGFAPLRDVLRAALQGAGGLRIDHILGLFRMWWIPEGNAATDGTYVGFDHDAMLAIVCLEAHRAGAIVIGEDLGTVEPWVQEELARRGILGTVISWFERGGDGSLIPVEEWRRQSLASVTVHDLPPTAGYLAGEHVRIRAELDLLAGSSEDEWAAAQRERDEWARLLRERGYLPYDADLDTDDGRNQMVVALHRALADSPATLIGVAVPDVVGDRRTQNQPGTDQEYPNWRMPVADAQGHPISVGQFLAHPGPLATAIMDAVRR